MNEKVNLTIDNIIEKRLQSLLSEKQLSNSGVPLYGLHYNIQQNAYNFTEVNNAELININRYRKPEFEPPYDSPLEEMFAWNIIKYLNDSVKLQKQVPLDTFCGRFRLDFMVEQFGRCIGLECDGEQYHCSLRDEWRDSMILETGNINAIYRFRGRDLFSNVADCLFMLSMWEPQLFLGRGLVSLKALASHEAKKIICQVKLDEVDHIFCGYEEYRYEYGINVTRHSFYPHNSSSKYLMEKTSFAKKHPRNDLDCIIKKFDDERAGEYRDKLI